MIWPHLASWPYVQLTSLNGMGKWCYASKVCPQKQCGSVQVLQWNVYWWCAAEMLSLFLYTTMVTLTLVLLDQCDTGGLWEPGGAAKLGGKPPFTIHSFKQIWSQKWQKAPTEKPFFWCPPVRDGWLEAAHFLADVQLPHQGSRCEALWQHDLRLHDVRKDKRQTGSLLPYAVKTKTAEEVYYNLPIHSFYTVVASKDRSYTAKEDSVRVPLTGAL